MPTKRKPSKLTKKPAKKKPATLAKKSTVTLLTQPTGGSVEDYFARITDAAKRAEAEQVHALIRKAAPSLKPRVWGQFIGYGSYHYTYASGREGDWFVIGLGALMKTGISVYACATSADGGYVAEKHRDELKPASVGKSCIRFKTLAKMDLAVLESVLEEAAAAPGFAQ